MTFESDAEVFPTQGTASLERFYTDHVRLMGFVAFVAELATRADDVVRIARKALAEGEEIVRFLAGRRFAVKRIPDSNDYIEFDVRYS